MSVGKTEKIICDICEQDLNSDGKKDLTIATNKTLVSYIADRLEIKKPMLGAILRIADLYAVENSDILDIKLLNLHRVISFAELKGVASGKMLSFLDLPFDETTDDSGTLLVCIVEYRYISDITLHRCVENFLKKNYKILGRNLNETR